ncbi:MAG: hypothetical protein ABI539_07245 [Acidobacteriota bacterium]
MKKLLFLLLALICAVQALSQIPDPTPKSEAKAKLKKEAIAFLRETLAETNNMRSLENRISFTSELAGLMWNSDEKEARSLYSGVINDFRTLLNRYDRGINEFGTEEEENGYDGGFLVRDPSERSRLMRRFTAALSVRQQIASGLAEHDPELAAAFFYDTRNALTNAGLREQTELSDSSFEFELAALIAETNVTKALEFGKKALGSDVSYQHIDFLKKIYAKDPEKGAEFALALLSRIKAQDAKESELYVSTSLLSFASETLDASKGKNGKKPALSRQDIGDLVEAISSAIMAHDPEDWSGLNYVETIEKYSPTRAAQIRAKFRRLEGQSGIPYANYGSNTATNVMYTATNSDYTSAYSNSMSNSNMVPTADYLAAQENSKEQERLMSDVAKLGSGQMPDKEQRAKVIAAARRTLMTSRSREQKIGGLSLLAAEAARAGDKELAAEIMKDVSALVNPAPKNYQDFILTWMLATGYASTDPDKAFTQLDDSVSRLNETIAAFVKVGEFIDVAEEMVVDGEIQVGAFGGQMIRGLTRELGMADATLITLANADFTKTKNLTNRFDRTEVRVLAKMLVLRAVLNEKNDKDATGSAPPKGIIGLN